MKKHIEDGIEASGHSKSGRDFAPIEFEKDDDTNFHVDCMAACANLRARNYTIPEADRHKTKAIAGKIIPAIATTTAAVTGLVCMEIFKLIKKTDDLEQFRDHNLNLAIGYVNAYIPQETSKIKYKEHVFTPWDTIDVVGPKTLQQFIDHVEQNYDVEVSMVSYGNSILYSFYGNAKKNKAKLAMQIEDVIKQITGSAVDPAQKMLMLDPLCSDEDGEDVDLPLVRYIRST